MATNSDRSNNLQHHLDRITTEKKDLKANLSDLVDFVEHNSANLSVLNDKAWHKIYENLFQVVVTEKHTLLHSKTTTSRSHPSKGRLEILASALRRILKAGPPNLRVKTLSAVIDHVTQMLQSTDGKYFDPVLVPYLKALHVVLGHQANVERMKRQAWLDVVDFCVEGIDSFVLESHKEPENIPRSSSGTAGKSMPSRTLVRSASTSSTGANDSNTTSLAKAHAEELLEILQSLVTPASVPISEVYETTTKCVLSFWQALWNSQGSRVEKSFVSIFQVLNRTIQFTKTDKTVFTMAIAQDIVPIISQFWRSKSVAKDEGLNAVRDEMLIFLFAVHPHLEKCLRNGDPILKKLEELADVLKTDYGKRAAKDQLQIDDLEMIDFGSPLTPFHLDAFRLRAHNIRGERNWAHLQVIGLLEGLISTGLTCESTPKRTDEELEKHVRKRQKVARNSDRILDSLKQEEEKPRVAGLQMIPFILVNQQLKASELEELLHHLAALVADKRGGVAVWALIAMSSCTFQYSSTFVDSSLWISLWRTGTRALVLSNTCRSASLQLHSILAANLLIYRDVSEDVSAIITSADVSGPVLLCDSSILLMMHLLQIRIREVPGASLTTSKHAIRWLFAKWDPADRSFATRSAIHVHPYQVMGLLRASLGLDQVRLTSNTMLPMGSLAQAWQYHIDSQIIVRYMLLLNESTKSADVVCDSCPKIADYDKAIYFMDTSHFFSTVKFILELLLSKSSELLQSWRAISADDTSPITVDTFRITVDTTMTMLLSIPLFARPNLPQATSYETCIQEVCKELIAFLDDSDARDPAGARSFADTLLTSIQPYLPRCKTSEYIALSRKNPHLLGFLNLVSEGVKQRQNLHCNTSTNGAGDPMDLDDDFNEFSQLSHNRSDGQASAVPRQLLALDASPASFMFVVTSRLSLLDSIELKKAAISSIPSSFIQTLCTLNDEDLLLNHQFLNELIRSDMSFDSDDAARVFERVLLLLKSPNYDLCEVSLMLALDCAIGLAPVWLSAEAESDLAELAMDFYFWLAGTALENSILSPELQKRSGELLLLLMKQSPEYGVDTKLKSARSLLFTLLEKSELCVKFFIADQLPDIFQLFLLEDHETIFLDILEVLPHDSEWVEGMCFRVIALSKLASTWPTLQRRCIYHIFEVPEKVPESLGHAVQCMSDVSRALKLESPLELFPLFAPQILYTWLEANSGISNLPFQIFGFSTLRELVLSQQDEIIALAMMLGQDEEIEVVISILGEEGTQMFERSFTKIIAYVVARDLSVPPPSSSEKRYITGESRLKKRLGGEKFIQYLNNNFVDIIALLFTISDPHDSLDKYLLQNKTHQEAGQIMVRIKGLTDNRVVLPPLTQPTFKAKKLSAQLDHLCTKTEFESTGIYTPALVVLIARKVSNTMHPALGSLHACAVLRKIRTLICFAGNSVTSGYPLEMLLQILQPYIKDPQCANDTIGIMQYLLESGIKYLIQVPTFVAGISLSVFGSLKEIAKADRASSTQESHHQNTISRITAFHKWFGSYLRKDYMEKLPQGRSSPSFQRLFDSACTIDWVGNAYLRTSESDLLLRLLQDELKARKLLNGPSREIALEMLCSDFQPPESFRTDVLGDDAAAIANAVAVWRSCRGGISNKKYLSWASRVLGRAFAASGLIEQDLLRESSLAQMKDLLPKSSFSGGSQVGIVNLLQELTLGRNKEHIGLAESALRLALATSNDAVMNTFQNCLSPGLQLASQWEPFITPPSDVWEDDTIYQVVDGCYDERGIQDHNWVRNLAISLVRSVPNNDLLNALVPVLRKVVGFAEKAFPFIIHLVLSTQDQNQHNVKKNLSASFNTWFEKSEATDKNNLKVLINAVLYLRTQLPKDDRSSPSRLHWLNVDYMKAATAATRCGMFKTALLFIEEHYSLPVKSSRRSSFKDALEQQEMPVDLLLSVYQSIEDPDMYYGVQQTSTLSTILARFEYEKDGPKSLAFRGAQFDSHIRRGDKESDKDAQSLVKALDVLSLSGLSHSLLQAQQSVDMSASSIESMYQTARKLEQWDIPVPDVCSNNSIAIYKAFQAINIADNEAIIREALDESFNFTMKGLVSEDLGVSDLHGSLQTLASLVEMDEIFSTRGSEQIEEMLAKFEARSEWMKTGGFDDVSQILSCRGTSLSTLSQRPRLQSLTSVAPVDTRLVEVRASLLASTLNRAHNALQESLSLATSMMDLIPTCRELSLNLDAAIHIEAANALWDQGETISSIGILQGLDNAALLKKQAVPVSRADLLSKTGYQVSVARLEKADKIIDRYLRPALKELKGRIVGSDASQVFHQFAVFCDQQLEDPDSLEDLERLKKLSNGKRDEVVQWEKLLKSSTSPTDRSRYKNYLAKAKIWYKLDEEELQRHISNRKDFLRSSLENYLLALTASDDHDSVALRFSALWLEHSEDNLANASVSEYLHGVPSRKFAPLMNQLTSRLQDSEAQFHKQLFSLVLRICIDHPYHGMYQIYSGTSTRPDAKDEAAVSRRGAARKVATRLSAHNKVGQIWGNLSSINKLYGMLAGEKDDNKYRSGKKINLKDTPAGMKLNFGLRNCRVPSPTLHLPLASNLDYSRIPVMVKLESQMTIASGVSAPKIITAIADTGQTFKQLVKGGNDDLRQDAIMEQVFEQVSELLKSNRSTRQRDLKIRTYRVLPLTSIAGVIEFVPNTIPLHEYLMPAHERYNPKDLKGAQCRKEIGEVQTKSIDERVKRYRSVTERFHPVMRYFFMEKFTDPDEWFVKRNAYTRSTAAISVLGHVLGLGDRHGHNILLDSESGEVVHIDLGVAFEMGRVLPVPELVPFRLTRDIVDGMGITKTEGIFRRCCEFTLEALRKEAYSIMTILDVLRYDPLYNWSISPVRLAKLQEGQSALANGGDGERVKEAVNEPGEADRALTVVNKKLSKTLSVQATVSDLINQASDEKNLAVLYSGWAAYA